MKVGLAIKHDQQGGRTDNDGGTAYIDVGIHDQMPLMIVATVEITTNAASLRDDDYLRNQANGMLS